MSEEASNELLPLPEEKDAQKQLELLESQAHEGALFANWEQQMCTVKMLKWLDEQIVDSRNRWLQGSEEEAKALRYEARAYQKLRTWIRAHKQAGEIAAVGLKEFHKEGVDLEGIIKMPPPAK